MEDQVASGEDESEARVNRYSRLAYQLFGKPVVNLTACGDKQTGGLQNAETPGKAFKLKMNRIEGKLTGSNPWNRCIICYSTICANGEGSQDIGVDLLKMFKILKLRGKCPGDEENVSAVSEAISRLSTAGPCKCLCPICASACQQLLSKQRKFLRLQLEVGELIQKILVAIQLSKRISEREPDPTNLRDRLKDNSCGDDWDEGAIKTSHLECVNVMRKHLLECKPGAAPQQLPRKKTRKNSSDYDKARYRLAKKMFPNLNTFEGMVAYVKWRASNGFKRAYPRRRPPVGVGRRGHAKVKNEKVYYRDMEIRTDEDNRFLCPIPDCLSKKISKYEMFRHIRKVHSDCKDDDEDEAREKDYPCGICGQSLPDLPTLNKHKRLEHRQHACDYCNRHFSAKAHLTVHLKQQHSSKRPFPCNICRLRFCSKYTLEVHYRMKHPTCTRQEKDAPLQLEKLPRKVKPKKKTPSSKVPPPHSEPLSANDRKNRKNAVYRERYQRAREMFPHLPWNKRLKEYCKWEYENGVKAPPRSFWTWRGEARYYRDMIVRQNAEDKYVCPFDKCSRAYIRISDLRVHIKRQHGGGGRKAKAIGKRVLGGRKRKTALSKTKTPLKEAPLKVEKESEPVVDATSSTDSCLQLIYSHPVDVKMEVSEATFLDENGDDFSVAPDVMESSLTHPTPLEGDGEVGFCSENDYTTEREEENYDEGNINLSTSAIPIFLSLFQQSSDNKEASTSNMEDETWPGPILQNPPTKEVATHLKGKTRTQQHHRLRPTFFRRSEEKLYYDNMEISKNSDDKFLCPFGCETTYSKLYGLARHITKAHSVVRDVGSSQGEYYSCDLCDDIFPNEPSLNQHKRIKHPAPVQAVQFICDYCEKHFKTKYELVIHTRRHTGERPYPCRLCVAKFTTNGNLKKHYQRVHSKRAAAQGKNPKAPSKVQQLLLPRRESEKSDDSEEDGSGVNLQKSLAELPSQQVAKQVPVKPHFCRQCGKGFFQENELTTHLKTHFSGEQLLDPCLVEDDALD